MATKPRSYQLGGRVSIRRRQNRHATGLTGQRSLCAALHPAEPGHKQHTYEVVFVRHGQSTWNKANRFIGWTDTELTEEGEIEARVAGQVGDMGEGRPGGCFIMICRYAWFVPLMRY